jgi:hypothetical protein
MLFLEVALQAIRGFLSPHRLPLREGLNVLRLADAEPRRALLDAVYHALFPSLSRADATAALADSASSKARIALTFHGRDRITYRVLREAVTGATRLFRYRGEERRFELFSRSAQDAVQYLRVQQRLPDAVDFERLLMFSPETMPSRGAGARARSGVALIPCDTSPRASAAPPGSPSSVGLAFPLRGPPATTSSARLAAVSLVAPAPPPARSRAEARVLLDRLRSELERAQKTARAEQQRAALERRRGELLARAEPARERARTLAAMEAELAALPSLEALPAGFEEQLAASAESVARCAAEHARWLEERTALAVELESAPDLALVQDRSFLASVGAAAVSASLALALEVKLLALLNPPFALLGAWRALRWIAARETRTRLEAAISRADDQLARIARQQSLDTAVAARFQERLGLGSRDELAALLEHRRVVDEGVRALRAEVSAMFAHPELARGEEELRRLELQLEGLTQELDDAPDSEPAELLARRVELLERELGAPASGEFWVPAEFGAAPTPDLPDGRAVALKAQAPAGPGARTVTADAPREVESSPPGTATIRTATLDLPRKGSEAPLEDPSPPPSRAPQPRLGTLDLPRDAPAEVLEGTYVPSRRAPQPRLATLELGWAPAEGPAAQPPAVHSPPAGGRRSAGPGPSPARALFDFGGGEIGADDDAEGVAGGAEARSSSPGASETSTAAAAPGVGVARRLGLAPGSGEALPADRSRELVTSALELLQLPVEGLARLFQGRLGEYLSALTDGAWVAGRFGPRGELFVASAGGAELPYTALEGEALDLVDTSLRFVLIEALVQQTRLPVLFDDPFEAFPAHRRRLLAQMLGYLGEATQVVVLSALEDLGGHRVQG